MDATRAEVRIGGRIGTDALTQALELTLANIRQALPLRPPGRPGIEIDRDQELGRRALAEPPGERHALVHRDVAHGDEGDHVGRAYAGVLAPVLGQVDSFGGDAHGGERGLDRGVRRGDEREHRAVVRCVGLHVEQANAGDGRERRAEGLEGGGVAALGEVRHTFDERRWHRYTSVRNAECGVRSRWMDLEPEARVSIPHSTLRTPHSQALLRSSTSQSCIRGLPATTEPCRSMTSAASNEVTIPPPSRTSTTPAGASHGALVSSQKQSRRPAAASTRSSAAAPARRMPLVAPITAANWSW